MWETLHLLFEILFTCTCVIRWKDFIDVIIIIKVSFGFYQRGTVRWSIPHNIMQCFMTMITESFHLTHDLFALYTTWLAFLDLLPEPPFSSSLTLFHILPNATPFARFSVWKSFSFAVMFCKVSRLLLLTYWFKAFLSLFVRLFFLPLRVKISTVPDSLS